jgi:hypothetical protein
MSERYLNESNVEDLGRMLMALTAEVWIMRDRMAVLERLLADKVGLTAGEIDDYVADAGFKADVERLRDRFVAAVVGAPLAARERSVDQILARAGLTRPAPST